MKRKVPVTFNIPPNVRRAAAEFADANGVSFSELVADLLREYLEKKGQPVGPLTDDDLSALKGGQKRKPGRPAKSKNKP